MKKFSEIRKGNPTGRYFAYEADENPRANLRAARGKIIVDYTRYHWPGKKLPVVLNGLLGLRSSNYRGCVRARPDTEEALKAVQEKLRRSGWVQRPLVTGDAARRLFHYKGYQVICEYDDESGDCGGHWQGGNTVVSFGGYSWEEAEVDFRRMMDFYLEDCGENGETPGPPDKNDSNGELSADME